MKPFSELKKIYLTEPPICYNIFKNEKPSFLVFKKELFSNPLYKNELTNYKKSEGIYYDSPEDFYYDCADLFSKFIFPAFPFPKTMI